VTPDRGRDRGSLTVFVAVLALALFVLVGLVIDGGRALSENAAAASDAEQAARLGAGQLSLDGIRAGVVTINPSAAIASAQRFLIGMGRTGTVSVFGQTVVVHVDSSAPTAVLGIIGIDHIRVSVTASATNVHGVTRSDP